MVATTTGGPEVCETFGGCAIGSPGGVDMHLSLIHISNRIMGRQGSLRMGYSDCFASGTGGSLLVKGA